MMLSFEYMQKCVLWATIGAPAGNTIVFLMVGWFVIVCVLGFDRALMLRSATSEFRGIENARKLHEINYLWV